MRLVIVDDEEPARTRLRQLIEDEGDHEIVGEAANGVDALQVVADSAPDAVLLDIRMPGMNGIETAHHINELESPPAIVFATAYDEYAIEAFDAQAIGYVLKPVRRRRLALALKQAARISPASLDRIADNSGIEGRRSQICVQVHGELKLVPIEDIAFFRSDQKYTRVADGEREYLIDDSLKQLEEEFDDLFVRIHRNALVAVAYVELLTKTEDGDDVIRLRDGIEPETEPLKVSRRHLAGVRRRLKGARP
ncbi:MAG: LytTR family DNA-binding domain-containing protein [Woeseiaceae bacterium]|nr:LytTR family DNA-binding domain-containing protein [Woeseiaceae bacterium]